MVVPRKNSSIIFDVFLGNRRERGKAVIAHNVTCVSIAHISTIAVLKRNTRKLKFFIMALFEYRKLGSLK